MNKNIISYSLWGNDYKYLIGAQKNCDIAEQLFPEYILQYHINHNVDIDIIKYLKSKSNTEIFLYEDVNNNNGHEENLGVFMRFNSIQKDKICFLRDCDSRLSLKEKKYMDFFINSDFKIHSIKDHPGHFFNRIMAGICGFKNIDISDRLNVFISKKNSSYYGIDQDFLDEIYLEFSEYVLNHHDYKNNISKNLDFIGQVYDENDNPHSIYMEQYKKDLLL